MIVRKLIVGFVSVFISLSSFAADNSRPWKTCSATAAPGTVALTFDDGPSKDDTKQILSILEHYHIRATFFVVGIMAKVHPEYLKQMIADGDVIGNHSMTHPQLPKLNDDQLYNEVVGTQNLIYQLCGVYPQVFRFPYGAENERVKQFVTSQNLVPVGWGYTPQDYERPGVDAIVNRVIANAKSGQIILLHDGPDKREQTVQALPKIIEGIQQKGLGFSVVCQ